MFEAAVWVVAVRLRHRHREVTRMSTPLGAGGDSMRRFVDEPRLAYCVVLLPGNGAELTSDK